MKIASLLIQFILISQLLIAQDKLIRFGKPDPQELELKDCPFEPGAPLYCLADEAIVRYNIGGSSIGVGTDRRVKFKILKDDGIASGNIKLRYYSKDGYESIDNVEGYVYNKESDGQISVTKLNRNDIYRKRIDDDYSEISFALPNIKIGSVFEYKYYDYKKTIADIRSWYFQHSYPVKYSAYNLLIPEYFIFKYQVMQRQEIQVKHGNYNDGQWYIMHNVPSLKDEPYMASENDFLQRVDFNLTTINPPGEPSITVGNTWVQIIDELLKDESFGLQIKKNIHHPADLDAQVALAKTDREKLETIYKYVQTHMQWNGDYARGSYEGGIKSAWDKKQGTTADINLLLIDLLRDFKIDCYPLLVSTRDNGKIFIPYPNVDQFNATMVYAKVDNTTYILNAADKDCPVDLIPSEIQFTQGLLADNKMIQWIQIADVNKLFKTDQVIVLDIQKDGKLSGFSNLGYYDYARSENIDDAKNHKLKELLTTTKGITLKVDSINTKNIDDNTEPLKVSLKYSGIAQNSGDYLLIPYNLFMGFNSNPFTAEKRQTDIDFGYLQNRKLVGYLNIDSSFSIEELPKNMNMIMVDSSIVVSRRFQKSSNNSVAFSLNISFLRPIYSAREYDNLKAFYKQMIQLLDERIVLKRKKI